MSSTVKVPDIGGFDAVEIIEILVQPGDTVSKEQSLITLESDKASMDIPCPQAGLVKRLLVKVGDKVSEGTPIMELAAASAAASDENPAVAAAAAPTQTSVPPATAKAAPSSPQSSDLDTQVLVLGAGPGGYTAAFRAADLGLKVVLVERYPSLGGVCLNVGCIPSKALLHAAKVITEAEEMAQHGVTFAKPVVDLDTLRNWKANEVVAKLTGGLMGLAKARHVTVIQGTAHFTSPNTVSVLGADGQVKTLRFEHAIIAAGSSAIKLPFQPDDPRVIDSTGALALADVPPRLLVIGGGIIGLEMGTVYDALGSRVTVVERGPQLIPGCDPDLVKPLAKRMSGRFEAIRLATGVTGMAAKKDGIHVTLEADGKPETAVFDRVLVAIGRRPNGKSIAAEAAGVSVDEWGFIPVDRQMRTNVPHIFAIGDLVGQPMLAHKAVHEAHVAAEAAAGEKAYFDASVIPSVAYTDPEVAWVGMTEDEAKAKGIKLEKGHFPWAASGRAVANGRDEGFTKLLFDAESKRIVGGGIVGTHAGDMIGEIALAIEMGADAVDIGKTIHPHPTLGESIGMAAEVYKGVCTDLPPQRKK